MSYLLRFILLYSLIAGALYGLLAVLTYNSIQIKIEKLEDLEQELIEIEKEGSVPYTFKQMYKREYDTYIRLQNRAQSFWMKWIFDFPEFRNP